MFHVCLRRAEDERLYSVCPGQTVGWEVRTEENRTLASRVEYADWHRVERTLASFRREIETLVEQGWRVQQS